jgi:hypothetical protein
VFAGKGPVSAIASVKVVSVEPPVRSAGLTVVDDNRLVPAIPSADIVSEQLLV